MGRQLERSSVPLAEPDDVNWPWVGHANGVVALVTRFRTRQASDGIGCT
jgi:hypothetical protein